MLANSHLGLTNLNQMGTRKRDTRFVNRSLNPGSGAISPMDGITFKTQFDSSINVGEEIFVDYGINYFHAREDKWNLKFPTKDDYNEADVILEEFMKEQQKLHGKNGGDFGTPYSQESWKIVIETLDKGEFDLPKDRRDDNDDDEKEEEKEKTIEEKEEEIKSQQRIAYALPKSVKDINHVHNIGTARYSVPNSKRSLDYLNENGFCLDNLRKGKSKIPQAGNGAFANNNIESGSVISPAPLVPVTREVLDMKFEFDSEIDIDTEQLLLNYCFGHPKSSLLFFPYSSSVHYINHDSKPNAYIRWSESKMSKNKMLEYDVDDVYTGLILEVVALRDISIGEEVTIDYGVEWTDKWHDHVESWEILDDGEKMNPLSIVDTFNKKENSEMKPIRTVTEESTHPYPNCIRTACYSEVLKGNWTRTKSDYDYIRFCDIIDREFNDNNYWYTAKVFETEADNDDDDDDDDSDDEKNTDNVVKYIPQRAVFLTKDRYCDNYQLTHGFRHAIGVPNGLYPKKWMDLERTDAKSTVTCDTTAGQFTLLLYKKWSPNGYDRAVELFERGFYDNTHLFRVIPDFLVQFGIR